MSKTKIFNTDQLTGLIPGTNTVLANVAISYQGRKWYNFNTPVLSIPKMAHILRQQIDCTLDGTVHIMSANGGIASCTLTCLDRLNLSCNKTGKTLHSALAAYDNIRKFGVNSFISVTLYSSGNKRSLVTFTGVLNGCSVSVEKGRDGGASPYIIVAYDMTGVWR